MQVQSYASKECVAKYARLSRNHPKTFLKVFAQILGSVKNKKILDIGCGDGVNTVALAKKGAHVIGIDLEPLMINKCKVQYNKVKNVEFFLGKAQNLRMFDPKSFEIVIINMVLPNIETKKEVQRIFLEISRVLKNNGKLIFSDINPASLLSPPTKGRWYTFAKDFNYSKDGSDFTAHVRPDNKTYLTFKDKHWTIPLYLECLRKNKMVLTHIMEVNDRPLPKNTKQIPAFIVFGAQKLG
ncbi:MAG: class I SAM-dependent methyltransferase [archaeon]|jgi:ubiquinone/menaquinone biosynthesis C-methylase UbiE